MTSDTESRPADRKRLQTWVAEILRATGVSESQAASVASALAQADARGIHTHGCEMLPRYVGGFLAGLLNPDPAVAQVSGKRAFAQWDGNNGLGHYACDVVTEDLIGRAKDCGIAAAAIGNSNHFGMASRYGLRLAEESLIGFVTTNTPPVMPALGGRETVLGNNPLAWVLPRRRDPAIALDMAVSAVARGKVRLAAAAGQPIPLGWATDANGIETTDAAAALEGALLPVGGPKGYGLAVVNEVLSAALPAARVLTEVSTRTIVRGDVHDQWAIGHFILAIDPSTTGPLDRYFDRVERIADVLIGDSVRGQDPVMLPGDPEQIHERRSAEEGITLPASALSAIEKLSSQFGLPPPW